MKIAKKEVGKTVYSKLSSISNEQELEKAVKYILINSIEHKYYLLNKKIEYLKQYGKNVFFAENKSILLKSKIHHFKATYDEEDYNKMSKIMKNLSEEISNV